MCIKYQHITHTPRGTLRPTESGTQLAVRAGAARRRRKID